MAAALDGLGVGSKDDPADLFDCQMESTLSHVENVRFDWPIVDALRGERRSAPRNSSLARAGDVGVRIRVIASGWAFRFRTLHDGRRQIINILLPGDAFGIETLFDHPMETSVQTSTAVTYLALSPTDLTWAFDSSAEFRRHLFNMVFAEKTALEDWLVRLGQCDAEERTAGLLMSLHTRLMQCGLASEQSFVLDLTQQEMADILGLHVIHLNRVLGRLRARKLLSISGKTVTLHDLNGLAEIVPPLNRPGPPLRLVPTDGSWDGFMGQSAARN